MRFLEARRAKQFGREAGRSLVLVLLCALPCLAQSPLLLPNQPDSLKFAVIGDNGTGEQAQYDVASQMMSWHDRFRFEFVVMNGDNIYGGQTPWDFQRKFEIPYGPLLKAGVKFYASLGNHDGINQRLYKSFNMDGKRYYTFRPKAGIRFFALDSNYMDRQQFDWLKKELSDSGSDWKICFFHHPLYSSGKTHGPDLQLRELLEPLFVKHNVSVVLSGHEHFYERIKPQKGIYYFISGGGGQLRRGDIITTSITARGFDQDNHFILMEISGDQLHFQTISRTGETVDSGTIERRRPDQERTLAGAASAGKSGK